MTRFIIPAMLLVACGDSKTDADSGDADADSSQTYSWPGGHYQMTSFAVADSCLDGGFVPLLLPEGSGSTNDWQYPIEVPAWGDIETPVTYTISLQDPFTDMEVTAMRGGVVGEIEVNSVGQDGVLFDEDSFEDCVVDMGIDALIVLDSDQNVHGYAELHITASQGDSCPLFDTPCSVGLDFTGLLID